MKAYPTKQLVHWKWGDTASAWAQRAGRHALHAAEVVRGYPQAVDTTISQAGTFKHHFALSQCFSISINQCLGEGEPGVQSAISSIEWSVKGELVRHLGSRWWVEQGSSRQWRTPLVTAWFYAIFIKAGTPKWRPEGLSRHSASPRREPLHSWGGVQLRAPGISRQLVLGGVRLPRHFLL